MRGLRGPRALLMYWPNLLFFFFPAFWREKKSGELSCASLAPIKKIASLVDAFRGAQGGKTPTPTYMYRKCECGWC
jgi:hypothetical protein